MSPFQCIYLPRQPSPHRMGPKSYNILKNFIPNIIQWVLSNIEKCPYHYPAVPTLPMPKTEQIGRPRYPHLWKIKCYFIKCLASLWLPSALLFFGSNTSAFSNSRSRLTFAHLAKDAGSGKRVRIGATLVVEFISSSAVGSENLTSYNRYGLDGWKCNVWLMPLSIGRCFFFGCCCWAPADFLFSV